MPAYGFFIRHVNGIEFNDVEAGFLKDDLRPAVVLNGVKHADFNNLKAQHAADVPVFVLKDVDDFRVWHSRGIPDTVIDHAAEKHF